MCSDWIPVTRGAWSGSAYWNEERVRARIDPYMVWADATAFADFLHLRGPVQAVPIIRRHPVQHGLEGGDLRRRENVHAPMLANTGCWPVKAGGHGAGSRHEI